MGKSDVWLKVFTITLINAEDSYKRGDHGLPNINNLFWKCNVLKDTKDWNPFNAIKTFINVNDDPT